MFRQDIKTFMYKAGSIVFTAWLIDGFLLPNFDVSTVQL
jgi:hypothetical protein